jgi:hypothetical protein
MILRYAQILECLAQKLSWVLESETQEIKTYYHPLVATKH